MVARFLLFIIVIYLLYKIVDKARQLKMGKNEGDRDKPSPEIGEDLVEDPICHTYVPISQAHKKEMSGKSYFFCSKQCSDKYVMEKK